MFVVVVVVMIIDGVEAVIVMSVRMMMMVHGIAEKVCQKEKSFQPFPNE